MIARVYKKNAGDKLFTGGFLLLYHCFIITTTTNTIKMNIPEDDPDFPLQTIAPGTLGETTEDRLNRSDRMDAAIWGVVGVSVVVVVVLVVALVLWACGKGDVARVLLCFACQLCAGMCDRVRVKADVEIGGQ